MYKIIDKRGTGKTSRLLLLAKENNGIVVCANPAKMREKAAVYGITGIPFISYTDYSSFKQDNNQPIFIDELDSFLLHFDPNLMGYNLSEDN